MTMARPKTAADERYNERRRQRRAEERARRAQGKSTLSSDDATNARKRYTRQAERYIKRAESSMGPARERYMELAKRSTEKAIGTYERVPKTSKMAKGLQRAVLLTNAQNPEQETLKRQREKLISESDKALEGSIQDRRQYESRAIMSSSIGSRIIASFEPIWREYATTDARGKTHIDWEKASQAIFQYMSEQTGREITDWMGVIEAFEENELTKGELYAEPGKDYKYDATVQAAQLAFGL